MNINSDILYTQSGRLKVSQKYPQFESKHISSANDGQWERRVWGAIINHGAVTGPGFQVGELFYETLSDGTTLTGKRGYITASTGSSITYNTTHSDMTIGGVDRGGSNNNFTDTYKITGVTSGSVATITDHDTGTHHYYDWDTSSVRMKLGLNDGDRAVIHSKLIIPYFSGFEPTIEQTFDINPEIGRDYYVLFGDMENGIGLWLNGLTPYFVIISSVSGETKVQKIKQEDWLNGRGINFDRAQIQGIVYKWLGYGNGDFTFVIDGQLYLVAQIRTAGKAEDIFMRTPSNPVYFEAINTQSHAETAEMRIVCSEVSSEGGTQLPGNDFVCGITMKNARITPGTTGIHKIFAVRLKNEFPVGKPNRKTYEFNEMEWTAKVNDGTGILYHVHNPHVLKTVGATEATWTSIDEDSAVEYSTDIYTVEAEHMHPIKMIDLLSGSAGKGATTSTTSEFITSHKRLSQNYESKNSELFLFCVENEVDAKPVTVSGHIGHVETE